MNGTLLIFRCRGVVTFVACVVFGVAIWAEEPGVTVIESFDGDSIPGTVQLNDVEAELVARDDGNALAVRFAQASRPGIVLTPGDDPWDWSGTAGIAVDVTNPQDESITVFLRVDSVDTNGKRLSDRSQMTVPANDMRTVRRYFQMAGLGPYWGMRGIPVVGPVLTFGPGVGGGKRVEPSQVSGMQVYVRRPEQLCVLEIDNVRVFTPGSSLEHIVPMPFVDKFGQYIHDDWPGKVHDDAEFQALHEAEDKALEQASPLPGRDRFGGWADGPQLEATGWFRTEKVDGKWWLVTPEGRLFLSLGVNCVRSGDGTFITGRDDWFECVPAPDGPFAEFRGHRSGAHSMAEPIGGAGDTFNFYAANLKRRYGDAWRERSRETAYQRLEAWGFNTIGNWSDGDLQAKSPMPFTVTGGTGGKRIAGVSGFWGNLIDVFDPSFVEAAEANLARVGNQYGDNPLVIGYFVDNEMSWTAIPMGVLNSPPDQAARVAFIEDLKGKYENLDALNEAWGAAAPDWDSLRVPAKRMTTACREDCDAFEYKFGRQYFDTVRAALKKHAPNQLYLGCRFTPIYSPKMVLKACAEVVDVISVNLYTPGVRPGSYDDLGKPYMIGEFHFGALDRGMFHQGLGTAADQVDRGRKYAEYVKSVATSPLFVGCHWFLYFDQPLTGRSHDGENYSIGLVTVVDVPHKTFLEAVRDVHAQVYTLGVGTQ